MYRAGSFENAPIGIFCGLRNFIQPPVWKVMNDYIFLSCKITFHLPVSTVEAYISIFTFSIL